METIMNIDINTVINIIGQKEIELHALRMQVQRLQAEIEKHLKPVKSTESKKEEV